MKKLLINGSCIMGNPFVDFTARVSATRSVNVLLRDGKGADTGLVMDCKNLIANANKMPRLELPALAQTAKDLF